MCFCLRCSFLIYQVPIGSFPCCLLNTISFWCKTSFVGTIPIFAGTMNIFKNSCHKLTFLIVGFVSKPRIPMKHSILCHIPNIHWLLVKFPLFHTHCTPCLLLVASYPIFVGQYHNWLVVSTRKICGSSPRLLAKLQHILDHQPHSFSWPSDPNFVCGILQLVALRLSLSGHLQILAPRLRGLSSLALEQEETHGNPGGPKGFSRILA